MEQDKIKKKTKHPLKKNEHEIKQASKNPGIHNSCADLEGGRGGPDPPWNLQSLISPILLEMKN